MPPCPPMSSHDSNQVRLGLGLEFYPEVPPLKSRNLKTNPSQRKPLGDLTDETEQES